MQPTATILRRKLLEPYTALATLAEWLTPIDPEYPGRHVSSEFTDLLNKL